MSSALLRFNIDASTISKDPSQCSRSLAIYPTSQASFLKNKNHAPHGFNGSICESLQYNPTRRNFVICNNNVTPPGTPLPSGSLRNWVVGIVLALILPLIARKGSLILFKNKVDTVMETMEHVMESAEKVAKGADEIIDVITDDLPQNSKLKETLEAIDQIVEDVAKHAHAANEIIDKVEETEKELESLIVDKVKEKEVSIRDFQEEVSTKEQSIENRIGN